MAVGSSPRSSNAAGIGPISRFDALRVDDWDAMIDVNLRCMLYGIAAALPELGRQRRGHVVDVLSTAGIEIVPTMGVQAAAKNATRTATRALRQESGSHLRVTEVSPGFVDTDFADTIDGPSVRAGIEKREWEFAIGPDAIARAVALATGGRRDRQHRRASDGAGSIARPSVMRSSARGCPPASLSAIVVPG